MSTFYLIQNYFNDLVSLWSSSKVMDDTIHMEINLFAHKVIQRLICGR